MTLDIVIKKEKENKIKNIIDIGNIDKYIIELIRISKFYKFELKIKLKDKIKPKETMKENTVRTRNNIDEQINKAEIQEEGENLEKTGVYEIINQENDWSDTKIVYNNGMVKIKNNGNYKIEKPKKIRYQELWEKEGFYQEKTTQVKVRVQLWPEHLSYDHIKRKRAFLFC